MKKITTLLLSTAMAISLIAQDKNFPAQNIYSDYAGPFTGDWKGLWLEGEPKFPDISAQVIPLGGGEYRIRLTPTLDARCEPFAIVDAVEKNGELLIQDKQYFGKISNQVFTGGRRKDKKAHFNMEKIVRLSPTLGAEPLQGALVMFDGTNLDKWRMPKPGDWKIMENGAVQSFIGSGSLTTKRSFKDLRVHLEFRTPFVPEKRLSAEGNSGIKFQKVYEIQILDTYGSEGYWAECGSVYHVQAPYVNMCAPPLQWQTYDITFYAARFNEKGEKLSHAKVSVIHNGVAVQKDTEIERVTGGTALLPRSGSPKDPAPFTLQSHSGQVQFRNIWVVEL